MSCLTLEFSDTCAPELTQTSFTHPLLDRPRLCVRGKTAGAFTSFGSFQWTTAVKALAMLAIKTCQRLPNQSGGTLFGGKGSLAASLDYSIDKECLWLNDMFGQDSCGRLLARRMILRSNPSRKRPGPVTLSINESFLSRDNLVVMWEGMRLERLDQFAKLEECLTAQVEPLGMLRAA